MLGLINRLGPGARCIAMLGMIGSVPSCDPAETPEPRMPSAQSGTRSAPEAEPSRPEVRLSIRVGQDRGGQPAPQWARDAVENALKRAGHMVVEDGTDQASDDSNEPSDDIDVVVLVAAIEQGITLSARQPGSMQPAAGAVARFLRAGSPEARRAVEQAVSNVLGDPGVAELAQSAPERRRRSEAKKKEQAAERTSQAGREADAWLGLDVERCRAAQQRGACEAIRKHVVKYPKGAHADQARALLSAYELKIPEIADDEAWQAVAIEKCRNAKAEDDCTSVRGYLSARPSGKHAADAQAALQQGAAGIRAALEEGLWVAAKPADCKAGATDDACDGVLHYLGQFPTGVHAKEANAALEAGNKKIEARQRQRDARQQATACEAKCRGICGSGASAASCMQGCKKRECK